MLHIEMRNGRTKVFRLRNKPHPIDVHRLAKEKSGVATIIHMDGIDSISLCEILSASYNNDTTPWDYEDPLN